MSLNIENREAYDLARKLARLTGASMTEVVLDAEASRQLDLFLRHAEIEIAEATFEQAQVARQAYQDFGKGRLHCVRERYRDMPSRSAIYSMAAWVISPDRVSPCADA